VKLIKIGKNWFTHKKKKIKEDSEANCLSGTHGRELASLLATCVSSET